MRLLRRTVEEMQVLVLQLWSWLQRLQKQVLRPEMLYVWERARVRDHIYGAKTITGVRTV